MGIYICLQVMPNGLLEAVKKEKLSKEVSPFWFCLYVECYLGVFISPNKVLHQFVYGLLFLALCITLSLLFGLLIEVS